MLIWSAFYLVSFRYSMQIRVNGKRPKSDEKLTHFLLVQSLHVFLYPVRPSICSSTQLTFPHSFCLSVCTSVHKFIHQPVHPSIRPSHIHQILGKSQESLTTPPCQYYISIVRLMVLIHLNMGFSRDFRR